MNADHQSFVSANLCDLLINAGVNVKTPYMWKRSNGTYILHTFIYDLDDYYSGAAKAVSHALGYVDIPAFQEADMEKILPSWFMEKENGRFRLVCTTWFEGKIIQGTRKPDLFARMVYEALTTGKIDSLSVIEKINLVI